MRLGRRTATRERKVQRAASSVSQCHRKPEMAVGRVYMSTNIRPANIAKCLPAFQLGFNISSSYVFNDFHANIGGAEGSVNPSGREHRGRMVTH